VNFAKLCGYEFKELDNSNQITLNINGDERKIKVLQQLEFSSER